jgi:serine/threonine-protein kinase
MYYNSGRIFLISFLVAFFTSIIVCGAFFFVLPRLQEDTVVPDLLGSTPEQARAIVEARGLLLIVGGEEENNQYAASLVCRQTPLPGSIVNNKSSVTVFISQGSQYVAMPDLSGLGLSDATVTLSDLGLKIGEVKSEEHAAIEADKIIRTVPESGAKIKRDERITIVLSRGVETSEVPQCVGKSLSTAKRLIVDDGFTVGNVTWEVSTEFNVGIVMRQTPRAGAMAKKGSNIDLVVATVLE